MHTRYGQGGPRSAAHIFVGEAHVLQRRQSHHRERSTSRGILPDAQLQRQGRVDVGGDRAGVLRAPAARGNRKHDCNVMIFGVSGQEETLARRDDCVLGGSYTWSWP